jgi:hypothetical protein
MADKTTTKTTPSKERTRAEAALPEELIMFHDEEADQLIVIDDEQCLDSLDYVGVYKLVAVKKAVITLEPVK